MITLMASAGRWTEQYGTLSEKAMLGVTMTLIGIVIVVLILALLSVLVSLLSRLLNPKGNKQLAQAEPPTRRPTTAPTDPELVDASQADADLIAVLSAAVVAYTADQPLSSTAGFIIRRFRRV